MLFTEYKNQVENIELSDYAALLNISRKWKSIDDKNTNMKIALLGSSSIQLLTSVVRALLSRFDICPEIYEGEYNGILMDSLDDNSAMYLFEPEYIVIIPDYRDICERKPNVLSDKEEIRRTVENTKNSYIKICEAIHCKLPNSQILLSNFVIPFEGSLGNLEANYLYSSKVFYQLVNIAIIDHKPSYVTMLDMEGLAEYIGKKQWFNESSYCLNKSGFSLEYIGYVGDLIVRQFGAFIGKTKKCLVLDLDNTLWGGVVGDLGYDGIMIDPNDAEGEAYQNFQKYVLELKNRGVILAICSKNDIENAKEPFIKNDKMILKLEDISSFVANWSDKASNIVHISEELNIGIDSLVFFDDNPTERALISEFLPDVRVIDVPEDPALFVRTLDQAHAFEWNQITKEDISRIKTYSENAERNNLLDSCVNYEDYLKKLEMHISVNLIDSTTLSRFSQLTNKSNQFNLRTQRYSEAEITNMAQDDSYNLLTVSLKDKFSNYGVIACVVLKFIDNECIVENWVMSCRVLKKTVEHYTSKKIVEQALLRKAKCIKGEYIRSAKNGMVENLYAELGYETVSSDNNRKEFIMSYETMKNYQQSYFFMED